MEINTGSCYGPTGNYIWFYTSIKK